MKMHVKSQTNSWWQVKPKAYLFIIIIIIIIIIIGKLDTHPVGLEPTTSPSTYKGRRR